MYLQASNWYFRMYGNFYEVRRIGLLIEMLMRKLIACLFLLELCTSVSRQSLLHLLGD